MTSHNIIGLMSGTSMDGVDLSFCTYTKDSVGKWSYSYKHARTYPFHNELLTLLRQAKTLSPEELLVLDKVLGRFFAICVNLFQEEFNLQQNEINAIASHGHTIFHQPAIGYTLQIGCGATIAKNTGIDVINDFRQKDVVYGGQGAPLVPLGDMKLFNDKADAFLNIGGFSNITFLSPEITAYDICPGNLPINLFAQELGMQYDKDGIIAGNNNFDSDLLAKLNELAFYRDVGPKSLGTEWLDSNFYPNIDNSIAPEIRIATVAEHIATQIADQINLKEVKSVLVTGGGAKNKDLIQRIKSKTSAEMRIPSLELVDFKEAITFGFLGALFLENEPNCLAVVTGAEMDVVGGVLHKV